MKACHCWLEFNVVIFTIEIEYQEKREKYIHSKYFEIILSYMFTLIILTFISKIRTKPLSIATRPQEIMFANWAPACRVLVDNVSEWFSEAWLDDIRAPFFLTPGSRKKAFPMIYCSRILGQVFSSEISDPWQLFGWSI